MPVVPNSDFVQSVMPRGELAYNTIDRATPESFGGQVGATLGQAGDQLMQHTVQRQQLANETNVNDVYVNHFSPAAREIYQNYMKLEGKDAEAQFPAFQQQMNDLRSQIRSGLPNAADPSSEGKQIHHIHPVKFGGDPVDTENKLPLDQTEHSVLTNWWNQVQRDIQKSGDPQ